MSMMERGLGSVAFLVALNEKGKERKGKERKGKERKGKEGEGGGDQEQGKLSMRREFSN